MDNLNVLDACNYFSESFNKFLQQTIPMASVVKHRNKNIYITHEAFKKIVYGGNTPAESDFAAHTTTHNALRGLTCNLCRNFECRVANNTKHNPKQFWSHVKSRVKTHVQIGNAEDMHGWPTSSF